MTQASKPLAIRLPQFVDATKTSLTMPENLSLDDWRNIGAQLGRLDNHLHWWIGDWWRAGYKWDRRRTELVNSGDWERWGLPSYQTCRNCGWVAEAFKKLSRRRDSLSFGHHAEVAGLEPGLADRLLAWCLEGVAENNRDRRSTYELRLRVRQLQAEKWKAERPALPRLVSETKPAEANIVSWPISSQPATAVITLVDPVPDRPAHRLMLDQSPGGGPVPPELADLKMEPTPEFDRVAFIKAAFSELSPEGRFSLVKELAAEIGYALTNMRTAAEDR